MNEDTGRTVSDSAVDEQVEPEDSLPDIALEDLPESLQEAVKRAGWTQLMPVQARAIPYMLAKRDLMAQSRTGSGKTGAFVLPTLDRVDSSRDHCQALILVPTRELARQVATEAERLSGDSGTRVVAVYGGVGYGPQIDAFKKGAHIVVGTPGRILDHLIKKSLALKELKVLVFDEADRMLSMGFLPDMRRIQKHLPRNRRINAYMFSATYPPSVLSLARQFMTDPETLSLSRDNVHVTETEHVFYTCPAMDKDRALARIIEIENPERAIIFCNTKQRTHYIAVVLQRFGYNADELSADLSQSAREKVLQRVREGKVRYLVATDVAARGIDIPELSHVIQYEPPDDVESYIHRAGRTGRAGGATGEAITLVAGMESMELKRISKRFNIDIEERELPSDEDLQEVVAERLTALLEQRMRDRDNLAAERAERFVPLAKQMADDDEGRELIAMLLDGIYQQALHTPPEPVEEPKEKKPKSSGKRKGGGGGRRRGGGRK